MRDLIVVGIGELGSLYANAALKRGLRVTPLRRMTWGIAFSGLAWIAAGAFQLSIDGGEKMTILWQTLPYALLTFGEVRVSATGLEFAYTQAPRSMKSTIMGFWLLCVTFGNVLVAFLSPMQTILAQSDFFWVFTALMTGAAIVFAILAKLYKGKTYLQA